ncbi:MAG: amidase family protein [Caldilineaceae bacterium]
MKHILWSSVLLVALLLTACLPPGVPGPTDPCANYDLPFPRPEPAYNAKRVRDLSPFADALAGLTAERVAILDALLSDATILDLQQALAAGTLTSTELVTYYLDRIRRYDIDKLNSVLELNPQALAIARQLDDERAAGNVRGNLHGIPVLLKDNIATGDGMHNSAGAYALKDWQPDRDAFLVQQLRAAGAIILGKANLSEWANYMDPCMPNGFSALGGQTRNPYGPFETYGSSSGSAVAVAANLAAASVGTETQGSIMLPAEINSVVGIKTSMGLVSRDYVVPLLEWQDVPGPMGRTVTDVAVLLTAMTGVDANDPVTQDAAALAGVDFTQFLSVEAAQTRRVGIIVYSEEDIEQVLAGFGLRGDKGESAEALRQLYRAQSDAQREIGHRFRDLGMTVVEVSALALPARVDVNDVLPYGFKDAINRFLVNLGAQVEVDSLEAIIALNDADLANRAPYGQGYLEGAQNAPLSEAEYLALKAHNQQTTRAALSSLFADYEIDVLLSDVGQAYAPAGFPAMTVPAGYDEAGQPTGLNLIADYLGEPDLIAVGFAFEQATHARRTPDLEATMQEIDALGNGATASEPMQAETTKPSYVTDLETVYGAPSQAGFGSAVFYAPNAAEPDLAQMALDQYKYFVGDLWVRYGEEAWLGPWKEVYARPPSAVHDIVGELHAIEDVDAALSVPMILDNVENADQARAALSAAFDDATVTEVSVFNLGDGAAMSGLLVAGLRQASAEAIFLVFLLD